MRWNSLYLSHYFLPIILVAAFSIALIITLYKEPSEPKTHNSTSTPPPQARFFTLQHAGAVLQGEWSHDDSQVLTFSEDGIVHIWNVTNGHEQFRAETDITLIPWDSRHSRLLTTSDDGNAVQVWDTANNSLLFSASFSSRVIPIDWLADSNQFVTLADNTITFGISIKSSHYSHFNMRSQLSQYLTTTKPKSSLLGKMGQCVFGILQPATFATLCN